ncbi:cell wall-binding repeat-containing protein [Candidatus Woesearchaeota archaeon]|nr:cell wall-binding repeat-containing protein [Candidatus Woesearchaeota archaeon]
MRLIILALITLMAVSSAVTADTIIANSANWENVYSAGLFAALQQKDFKFLTSVKHGQTLKDELKHNQITVIESDTVPFQIDYAQRLKDEGFDANTIRIPEKAGNLDLAKRIDVSQYYIVDPALAYDAISALPLAVHNNAYVLFADKQNIANVTAVLAPTDKITIIGDVDEEVKQALVDYNPEVIRMGSRYKNNIALVDLFKKQTNAQQALLTNGEFLVEDLFTAGKTNQPIIFIGRNRPPEETSHYLRSAGFETMVLIGNDLIDSARRIKDLLQIPLFIKFGKGTTEEGGSFKKVQGLDMYPVPKLDILLSLQGVKYNTATRQVELYIKNEKELRTHLRPSIGIKSDGQLVATVGDAPLTIEGQQQTGYVYDADLLQYLGTNLTAEISVPYGYTEDEMDEAIEKTTKLELITFEDDCEMKLENAVYNEETQRFEITLKSNDDCYAQATLKDLIVDDERISPQGQMKEISGTGTITVKQKMNKIDIADNPQITIEIKYGAREGILTKTLQETMDLILTEEEKTKIDLTTKILLAVIVILLLILIWKKKKRY